jgi:hypothetical protein
MQPSQITYLAAQHHHTPLGDEHHRRRASRGLVTRRMYEWRFRVTRAVNPCEAIPRTPKSLPQQ